MRNEMITYNLYRSSPIGWILLRTCIETLELARKLRDKQREESPKFRYKIVRVTTTDVEVDP